MRPGLTLPLGTPVTVLGQRYEALTFRQIKKCDRRRVHGGTKFEVGINLAARLANVPPAVLYALGDADAERVGAVVNVMLDQVL